MAVTDIEEDSGEDIIPSYYGEEEYTVTPEQVEVSRRMEQAVLASPPLPQLNQNFLTPRHISFGNTSELHKSLPSPDFSPPVSVPGTPGVEDGLLPPQAAFARDQARLSSASVLSLNSVVGDKKDFKLQKVDPFFTDSTGEYYKVL
jgi:alpha-1,3-glucan synthase